MEGSGESPIIVKKVKKGHGGHHGGAWKVAYADFVTAMMALSVTSFFLSQLLKPPLSAFTPISAVKVSDET